MLCKGNLLQGLVIKCGSGASWWLVSSADPKVSPIPTESASGL